MQTVYKVTAEQGQVKFQPNVEVVALSANGKIAYIVQNLNDLRPCYLLTADEYAALSDYDKGECIKTADRHYVTDCKPSSQE